MRIGIALGGGGAKGLAHIPILETLEEMGVRPSAIAGTSIGAVVGAAYASGVSAADLRGDVEDLLFGAGSNGGSLQRRLDLVLGFRQLFDLIDLDLSSGGFLRGEKVLELLYEGIRARSFEELEIPLKIVATEFWSREQVVFDSGELREAVRASMSLPVLFAPVVIGDRVLMDGGAVNPVPFDLLLEESDVVIAVDVAGERSRTRDRQVPTLTEAIFNTFQIMSKAISDEKLRLRPPHIYLRPPIVDVQVLEFEKAHEIYEQAAPACRALREQLGALL